MLLNYLKEVNQTCTAAFFILFGRCVLLKDRAQTEHDVLRKNADNVCRAGRVLSVTRCVLDKVTVTACDTRCPCSVCRVSALVEARFLNELYDKLFSSVCVPFPLLPAAMYTTVRLSKMQADCRR